MRTSSIIAASVGFFAGLLVGMPEQSLRTLLPESALSFCQPPAAPDAAPTAAAAAAVAAPTTAADQYQQQLPEASDPAIAAHAQFGRAIALQREGDNQSAIAAFERVVFTSPVALFRQSAADKLATLLEADPSLKQQQLRLYWDELGNNPRHAELLQLVLQLQQDKPHTQLNTLALVLPANADNVPLQHRYAQLLLDSDQIQQAENIYQSIMREHPTDRQLAGIELARIARQRNQLAQARTLLVESSMRIAPGQARNLFLAQLFLEMNMPADAIAIAAMAMDDAETAIDHTTAATTLAEALLRNGNHSEARQLLLPIAQAEQPLCTTLQSRAIALLKKLP